MVMRKIVNFVKQLWNKIANFVEQSWKNGEFHQTRAKINHKFR